MTALSPYTQIYTNEGIKNAYSIMSGNLVYDGNGNLTQVTDVEYSVEQDAEIEFANKFVIQTSVPSEFIYQKGTNIAYDLKRKGWLENGIDILNKDYEKYNTVISEKPVILNNEESFTVCDSYLLGLWLGDGCKANSSVSCGGCDLEHLKKCIINGGYEVGSVNKDKRSDTYQVVIKNGFKQALRKLGILHCKHIPKDFIRYSFKDRLSLIQGLVDSDGTVENRRGRVIFTNTNEYIVDGLIGIATSIGETVYCSKRICKGFGKECECYFVEWTPVNNPAKLPRKTSRFVGRKVLCNRGISDVRIYDTKSDKIRIYTESGTILIGKYLVKVSAK